MLALHCGSRLQRVACLTRPHRCCKVTRAAMAALPSDSGGGGGGVSGGGGDQTPAPPPQLLRLAGAGGWAVRAADSSGAAAVRAVAIVDGPNIAVRCARATGGDPTATEARFRAWLDYLTLALSPAAVIVAFDNVQSASGGARTAVWPAYKRRRAAAPASAASGGGGGRRGPALAGWAHLDAACRAAGAIPAHAAVGYEADDLIAAIAEWLRAPEQQQQQQLQPTSDATLPSPAAAAAAPASDDVGGGGGGGGPCTTTTTPLTAAVLVSGDADVRQALGLRTAWLELLQAPARRGAASALRLEGAAEFGAAHGYPPAARACFLALAGKREAGVPGTGLSERAARGLAARYAGDLEAVLAAAAAGGLAPATAARLLPGPGTDAARRNWRVLRLAPEAHAAPLKALAAELRRSKALEGGRTVPPGDPTHDEVTQLVRAHPSVGGRWASLSAPIAKVAAALARAELPHAERWVCPRGGAPLDLAVRVYDSRGRLLPSLLPPGAASSSGGMMGEPVAVTHPFSPADSIAVMVIAGGDLAATAAAAALDIAALPPARLLRLLSPGAKRRLSYLRTQGWRVALVPVGDDIEGGEGSEDDAAFDARVLAAIVSA